MDKKILVSIAVAGILIIVGVAVVVAVSVSGKVILLFITSSNQLNLKLFAGRA